ncbi:MFS monocarboxylate [Zalerion maritima]|uniref:MFS monocarboxylate n=1 Tax=Zalerion maritima TaxID=339359 RepID=A0AAD5WNT1_9PEZI|nr:MFS monocarboxylate [Zalerion maritima]
MSWKLAMVVLFAIMTLLVLPGSFAIRPRMAGTKEGFWKLRCFTSMSFLLLTACLFGLELVLFSNWGIIPEYSLVTNRSESVRFWLLISFNLSSCLGRILPPFLADQCGHYNTLLGMCVFTLVSMIGIWLPLGDKSLAALYAVAILNGFGTGSFVALGATTLSTLCSPQDFGKYLGSAYTLVSFATLLGNPASHSILESGGPEAVKLLQQAPPAVLVQWVRGEIWRVCQPLILHAPVLVSQRFGRPRFQIQKGGEHEEPPTLKAAQAVMCGVNCILLTGDEAQRLPRHQLLMGTHQKKQGRKSLDQSLETRKENKLAQVYPSPAYH